MLLQIDRAGRLVIPKSLRETLGLVDGGTVDVSTYGAGLQIVPSGRTARLVEGDDGPVLESETVITDDDVFGLIDAGRR